MARNKNFVLAEGRFHTKRSPHYMVHLKSTGTLVAQVTSYSDGRSWRFTLVNYSHNHSKPFGTLETCLKGLEKEVL